MLKPGDREEEGSSTSDDVVSDVVSEVIARMHGIKAEPSKLGPVPTSKIEVDGLATEALLDTGSPVSIVSLDFFLKAAAAKRPKEQSPTDWGREVKKRLAPTAMSLRSYGGADIPLVAQVSCALARGNLRVDAQLQVQQGAPVYLLLGTDTLAKLGFTLTEQQDPAKDVLPAGATTSSRQQHDQHEASIPPDGVPTLTTSAVVRLIRPARVPAGHSKVVRVEVTDQDLAGETCLIEPFLQHHREDISVPDTLVGVNERSEAAVVIANTGCAPVLLREGRIIGNIQSCDVCPTDTPSDDGGTDFQEVNMSAIERQTDSGRMEKLLDALSLDTINLPPERKSELLSLLNDFPYLFALDPTELGRTSLVTHRIDTGDSVPIRQQPRRVPFALRDLREQIDSGDAGTRDRHAINESMGKSSCSCIKKGRVHEILCGLPQTQCSYQARCSHG